MLDRLHDLLILTDWPRAVRFFLLELALAAAVAAGWDYAHAERCDFGPPQGAGVGGASVYVSEHAKTAESPQWTVTGPDSRGLYQYGIAAADHFLLLEGVSDGNLRPVALADGSIGLVRSDGCGQLVTRIR